MHGFCRNNYALMEKLFKKGAGADHEVLNAVVS